MKRTLYTIFCTAIALAAVSCQKAEIGMTSGEETASVMEQRTITAVQDGLAKTTTSDDIHINWEKGDAIKVFDSNFNAYKFVADDAGFMTTFTGEVPSDATLKYAVYPYSDDAVGISKGMKNYIPENQDGKFNGVILGGVMAADGLTMKFTAVTSVIKLNVPASDNVQTIRVASDQFIAGGFNSLYDASSNTWTTTISSTTSEQLNMVTVKAPKGSKLSGDVFITVFATTKAPDLAFTFYNPEKHGKKAKKLSNPLVQNRITDLGVSKIDYTLSNGAFTVDAEGHQVYFTKGNLQYQPSTKTWRLGGHGYDFVGSKMGGSPGTVFNDDGITLSDNILMAKDYEGWIDLFAFGVTGYKDEANGIDLDPCNYMSPSGSRPAYKSYAVADLDENTDWGKFCDIQGVPDNLKHNMRVLTTAEWQYLATRDPMRTQNQEPLYFTTKLGHAQIVVDDNHSKVITSGTVLLPEVFEDPETSLENDGKFLNRALAGSGYENNKYTKEGWAAMEANGAVMIPACGFRGYNSGHTFVLDTSTSGIMGDYWTSTHSALPNYVIVGKSHIDGHYDGGYTRGYGVRLVWNAETAAESGSGN